MILRPYGLFLAGELRFGLELVREKGVIVDVRPHTGIPDRRVLSVPFVNAHSHLEYRGLQGRLDGLPYWEWIRELTSRKSGQSPDEVKADCFRAAAENRDAGVGLIGEHSDRPFSGAALASAGIDGIVFQEVITFFERDTRDSKLAEVRSRAETNQKEFGGRVCLSPHSLYTVDSQTLREFGDSQGPISLHLAESEHERAFFAKGQGPIAEFYRRFGFEPEPAGKSPLEVAASLGLARPGMQFVHGCDLDERDQARLASSGASVVHCPRSNKHLGCPPAPVFEYLRTGVDVGLGMDSPASGGPIDMFAEMREALATASLRGRPLDGSQVWNMATTMGARTLGVENWDLVAGFKGPLIEIELAGMNTEEDLISNGSPQAVRWIE